MEASLDSLLDQVLYQNKKRVKEDIAKLIVHTKTLLARLGTTGKCYFEGVS